MHGSVLALCIMLLHVIAFHTPIAYMAVCDIAVFMNGFTLCVYVCKFCYLVCRECFDGNL